jgi:hypothetical protein
MKKLLLTAAVAPLFLLSSKVAFAEPQAAEEAASEVRDGENTNESIFSRHRSYRVVYGAPYYYYSPYYGYHYGPYTYAHRHGRLHNWFHRHFHRHHNSTKVKVKVKNSAHGHHSHSSARSSTTVKF